MGQYDGALNHRVYGAGENFDSQCAISSAGSLDRASNTASLPEGSCLQIARKLLMQRRRRLSYFSNSSMFAEPSWDILLCMFVAQAEARPASLGELSIAANCAQSTALRWLNVLTEEGLVSIVNHSENLPEIGVGLSAQGYAAMSSYLSDLSTD